ncbi:glutathione S-transferase family protein [uncultured Shewanella sp.]|uniref:glutathione S-transferase family protein n=1 Tax=Shewanella atlantica TaxID=271099 RepID=UPI00263521BB|nr:glutathione S-transferase family protein [uncultured Shewanella sp.]
MGLLHDGVWKNQWYPTKKSGGKFIREKSQFRHWITSKSEGVSASESVPEFIAEPNRYHLYVSLACPWAHRTLIFRELKSLQAYISVSVVEPHMLDNGWEFSGPNQSDAASHIKGAETDRLNGKDFLYQIYQAAASDYTGRVTVPVLWDKKTKTIVNNESADIIRMFNSAFDHLTGNTLDLYPEALRAEIDEINDWVYSSINNGVYRAGFATSQEAYDEAFDSLFDALDKVELILQNKRYLVGGTITEADWRLFTTLIRFDSVYVGHFKANRQTIEQYPAISAYLRELYQVEGIQATVNFEHIKQHYYFSHDLINPSRVVPKGPFIDYLTPHGRELIDKG